MHVVMFSGGKDSTAMLLMMIEKEMQIDKIMCVDTTKEFPAMYDHINRVQDYINREIEIIKIDFDYWFGDHIKTKGKNKGQLGYGWPDFRNRWCTALKREAIKRELKQCANKADIVVYQGIAYDEAHRTANNAGRMILYPLVTWQITEKQALDYCYSKGFNWGGLYNRLQRVSCYCCPLSRLGELEFIYDEHPDLWQEMKQMDKKSFRQFKPDYSLDDLEHRFETRPPRLF